MASMLPADLLVISRSLEDLAWIFAWLDLLLLKLAADRAVTSPTHTRAFFGSLHDGLARQHLLGLFGLHIVCTITTY